MLAYDVADKASFDYLNELIRKNVKLVGIPLRPYAKTGFSQMMRLDYAKSKMLLSIQDDFLPERDDDKSYKISLMENVKRTVIRIIDMKGAAI